MQEIGSEGMSFHRKREEFAKEIRRKNIGECLQKRRNMKNEQNDIITAEQENIIVDYRYEQPIKKCFATPCTLQNMKEFYHAINSEDIQKQHYGVIGIRKLLQVQENPPIQLIIYLGLVPKLIELAKQNQFPQLELQAMRALVNITLGNQQQISSIIKKDGTKLFIKKIQSLREGVADYAVQAVANIALKFPAYKNALIKQGAMKSILKLINNNKENLVEIRLQALSHLFRNLSDKNGQPIKQILIIMAEMMVKFDRMGDETFSECCWVVASNFNQLEDEHQKIISKQFIQILLKKLSSTSALRSIKGSVTFLISQITKIGIYIPLFLEKKNFISNLYSLLCSQEDKIQLIICVILSNITGCELSQLNQIIDNQQLIDMLLTMFQADSTLISIKVQICYIFGNMAFQGTYSTPKVVIADFYKKINIIKYYLEILKNSNADLLRDALRNLQEILFLGEKIKGNGSNICKQDLLSYGGFTLLQSLQSHPNQIISKQVVQLIKQFFQVKDERAL